MSSMLSVDTDVAGPDITPELHKGPWVLVACHLSNFPFYSPPFSPPPQLLTNPQASHPHTSLAFALVVSPIKGKKKSLSPAAAVHQPPLRRRMDSRSFLPLLSVVRAPVNSVTYYETLTVYSLVNFTCISLHISNLLRPKGIIYIIMIW